MAVMAPASPASHDSTPTLRWVFSRADARVQCELSLDSRALLYQFRIRYLDAPASESVEEFRDVGAAFQRQSEFEASLVRDGWTLQHYEKLHTAGGMGIENR